MKRSVEEEYFDRTKRTKLTNEDFGSSIFYTSDVLSIILQFMKTNEILQNCSRVSKTWLEASQHVKLSLDLKNNRLTNFLNSQPENLVNLTSLKCSPGSIRNRAEETLVGKKIIQVITSSNFASNLTELSLIFTQFETEQFEKLVSCPLLCNLTTLDLFGSRIGFEGCKLLANSQYMAKLRDLAVWDMKDDGLKKIACSKNMQNLENLYLSSGAQSGFESLTTSPYMSNIRELWLYYLKGDHCLKLIATSQFVKKMENLFIRSGSVTDEGVKNIATSTNFSNLKNLSICRGNIKGPSMKLISECAHLGKLSKLSLVNIGIGDEIKQLTSGQNLSNLVSLSLTDNGIGDVGITSLASSSNFSQLQTLSLSHNKISFKGVNSLSCSPHLSKLTNLSLNDNEIGWEGAKSLSTSGNVKHLKKLMLNGCKIGNKGLKYISDSTELSNLMELGLSKNEIGNKGISLLSKSIHVKKLNVLVLNGNDISDIQPIVESENFKNTQITLSNNRIQSENSLQLPKNIMIGK